MRNSRAKRRTHTYVPTELRIMRAASPARHNVVVLLRRDVFVLKIRAGNAQVTYARILKGVYEVNHLVCTYMTYIHM